MKKSIIVIGLGGFFACAFTSPSVGQMSAPEILQKVSETYRSLRAFSLVADQEYSPQASEHISLTAEAPSKMRLELKDMHRHLLFVSDGETVWTYDANRKRYTKEPAPALASAVGQGGEGGDQPAKIPSQMWNLLVGPYLSLSQDTGEGGDQPAKIPSQMWNLLVGRYLNLSQDTSAASLDGKEKLKFGREKVTCWRVRLTFQHSTHELWIQQDRFLVLRHQESHDVDLRINGIPYPSRTESTVDLKEADINPPLDPSTFTFKPPDNAAEVESLSLLKGSGHRK